MTVTTISEKLQKLEEVKIKLKSEFIGINSQIDQLINYIIPWYCTPEILDKPALVFLAGMTGNGKTSVVRKLLAYLGIEKQLFFDCGEETSNNNNRLSNKLKELFSGGYYDDCCCDDNPFSENGSDNGRSLAFVFDEFQYCRSIDEDGREVNKGSIRAIWNLIDSGVIDDTSFNRKKDEFLFLIDCIQDLNQGYPKIQLKKLEILNYRKELRTDDFWGISRGWSYDPEEHNSWKIIESDTIIFLKKLLDSSKLGLGRRTINRLNEATTLDEVISILDEVKPLLNKPRLFNCSKSIIFILGNIDEAFNMHGELSPEISADMFHENTKKVNVTTIKNALKSRFRVEQLSRLGNNMIIYPSLNSENFKEIIRKELDRISNKIKDYCRLQFTENVVELLYSEGVFPAQGVRPVLTTVNSIISPKLSDILIKLQKDNLPESTTVIIDTKDTNFEQESTILLIKYNKNDIVSYTIPLTLGVLRDVNNDRFIKIKSIHEASHAVVYAIRSGKAPSSIISLAAEGGGFMAENLESLKDDMTTKYEVDSKIMTCLAGYCGEREFFDEDLCTFGSNKDLDTAWSVFSKVVYAGGYFGPFKFIASPRSYLGNSGEPLGLTDETKIKGSATLESLCKKRFIELTKDTKTLIENEKELIKRIAKYLVTNRIMSGETFLDYIDKYGKTISPDKMKTTYSKIHNYDL